MRVTQKTEAVVQHTGSNHKQKVSMLRGDKMRIINFA